jgi:nucleoside-diphosphate-sugar epimerase
VREKERQKFLVTGGAGFYGIHTVKVLLQFGNSVVVLGTSPFPHAVMKYFSEQEQKRLHFVKCDISDNAAITGVFNTYQIDVVIHAAVMTVLGEDEIGRERQMTEVNALGTLNLLEAARSHGVQRFVYISSSGLYGGYGQGIAPVHETVPVYPGGTSVYRACKIYSEMLCQNFQQHGAFRVVIARIGSPYGPWERPTRSRKGMSLIYQLMEFALKGEKANVLGRDVMRDWTHMRDIARGTVMLSSCEEAQLKHTLYNVADGITTSIEHVLQTLKTLFPKFSYEFVDRDEDANLIAAMANPRGPLDISRIREDVGFSPEFDIDRGLADYQKWSLDFGWLC